MITRGHYIGEVIDFLSDTSSQVAMRNQMGFTDLSVFVENYMRDVLNIVLGANLASLNAERSNEPGLDLGDTGKEIGFQVTSRADSKKVFKTLDKLTADQKKNYKKIVVLVVGKKQSSYTLEDQIFKDLNFTAKDVWDLSTLARKIVSLDIVTLRELHKLIRAESTRLRIELARGDTAPRELCALPA